MKKGLKILLSAAFALSIAGCANGSSNDDKTIKIGATAIPHAEILNDVVKDELEKEGYTLEVTEFTDYVTPNTSLEDGDLDANYFQHKPYLDDYNKNNSTDLVSAAAIHYEPFGLYSTTIKSLDELKDGDKIAVPNDATNEARALLLLQDNGVIKLKKDASLSATKNDIVENPKNLDITEIEAAQVPRSFNNVAIAAIYGNYAVEAGLKVSDAIAVEAKDSLAAETYANIVAVRPDNKDSEKIKALVSAIQSDKVKTFIDEKYQGAVVAVF